MEQLPIGILVVFDALGRSMLGNGSAREILGLPSGEAFPADLPVFRTTNSAIAVRDARMPWRLCMQLGNRTGPVEYEIVRGDGARRVVSISAAPIFDDADSLEGAVATLTDVTALRTQERLMRGERDLLAALMAEEQRVVRTLERAHLPQRLPSVPGFILSGLYVPPRDAGSIGGDWYDAFRLPDGRIGFSIGDVMGHGLEAAVLMGRLRSAIQSVGFVSSQPRAMLDAANATLIEHDRECIATAIAGVLDPQEATLTFATAGHPLPLLRKREGYLVAFEGAAPPLGVYESGDAYHHFVQLDPGDIAVLYTDGLVEVTRDANAGELLLRAVILTLDRGGSNHAAAVARNMVGSSPPDDVAVLTIMRQVAA